MKTDNLTLIVTTYFLLGICNLKNFQSILGQVLSQMYMFCLILPFWTSELFLQRVREHSKQISSRKMWFETGKYTAELKKKLQYFMKKICFLIAVAPKWQTCSIPIENSFGLASLVSFYAYSTMQRTKQQKFISIPSCEETDDVTFALCLLNLSLIAWPWNGKSSFIQFCVSVTLVEKMRWNKTYVF